VYIGRPSVLGNPYAMQGEHTRDKVVREYESWLEAKIANEDPCVIAELTRIAKLALDGTGEPVGLVCFCAPKACHGDVLKKVIERAIQEQNQ
jgi:hypothetical protein